MRFYDCNMDCTVNVKTWLDILPKSESLAYWVHGVIMDALNGRNDYKLIGYTMDETIGILDRLEKSKDFFKAF